MTPRHPGTKTFPFENPRSIILDPLSDDHFAANIHQIKHASDRVAGGSVSLFFFASAYPGQRVQSCRFSGPNKVKLDDPFQVFIRLLLSAHDGGEKVRWGRKDSSKLLDSRFLSFFPLSSPLPR